MKWVGLAIILAAIIPISAWLRRDHRAMPIVLMIMGFLPFIIVPLHMYMAAISWAADWPGYVQGTEFSILDSLALALYYGSPRARHPAPFRLAMALYFLAALLSALQADVPMAALFYAWQLARMFLVYAAIARACANPRAAPALLKGMALGVFMEAGLAIWERFGLGVLQAAGTFGHQNLLGLISHLVIFPFFAVLLTRRRGWLPPAVVLSGIIIEVLTTSRATVGLSGFAYGAVFALSAVRRWSSRKASVLVIGLAASAVFVPLALTSFEHRFATEMQSDDDYDERAAFQKAAAMMLSDHPFGIGANHYVLAANSKGYNNMAGVAPISGSEGANVHNIYWLIAAETGYPGLVTFLLLLFQSLMVAFLCGWRARGDDRGDLLLGLGVALLTVYIHSYFEWIFITFQAQYMFALDLGLVAGLAQQLGYRRRPVPIRLTRNKVFEVDSVVQDRSQ